ncbi:MAG TPA: threonine dehydratase [Solirubrobacteraceae bacterium]|nr:threonine dehydratase [Solirubrobacteraceae bacterium]
MPFTLADLDRATELVRRHVPATPTHRWPLLAEALGAEVWVKHENHTPTGAFKVRGGLVYVERLTRERPQVQGLVSATRGNHGQSIAYAGRAAGLAVSICVPFGNSPDKNAAMRAFGATVVEVGHDYQAAREHAAELAGERGFEYVPPFHRDLVLGVATYARELFESVADIDVVYVPVGMGSGVSGLIGVRDLLGLRTEIVGVVSELAPAIALSFAAGEVVTTESADTFVDGVACRVPDPAAIETLIAGAARVVAVSEDATAAAMRLLFAATHNAPEPAGAIALAGAMAERERINGRRVAVVQTGGNVDSAMFADVLRGATPVAAGPSRRAEAEQPVA